ncbi:MAG: hypothetical protein V6Z81_09570 [Parvularculales bacterium]
MIDDVVSILNLGRSEAAKLLSRWTEQGWLRRVGCGAYVPAPVDALDRPFVLEDPWVLVPALFDPAYIGGWSAASHWDLTEQLFRDTVVLTSQQIREKHQSRHGARFLLRHIQTRHIFGTKSIWRGKSKVAISDIHRTVIDMLDTPSIGGGIQHVTDCLKSYFRHSSRSDETLILYAERLGNGSVFKRLGYLAEMCDAGEDLQNACREHMTAGLAKLDPGLDCTSSVTKWRLLMPESWRQESHHDQ